MDDNLVFGQKPAATEPAPFGPPVRRVPLGGEPVPSQPMYPQSPQQVPEPPQAQPPQQVQSQPPLGQLSPDMLPPEPRSWSPDGGLIKKLIIAGVALIILIVLVILLWPKGPPKTVTLTWWGLWEDPRVVQPIIADFERSHPLIKISYVKESPQQYRERLFTRMQNGTGPDIFRFHNTWYPMFADALLPLSSDVISQAEFKKNFYPVMQSDLIHNGALYGIPLETDTLSLFVNTDLLDAVGASPPVTWDDFVKAAKKLTVRDADGKIKTAGAALGLYGNVAHAPDIVSLLFAQQGLAMKDLIKNPAKQADSLNFYSSFARGDQSTWDQTLDNSLLAFSRGSLAMYFGFSWDIFTIQRLNKDLHFAIRPVPNLYGQKQTIASYWVEGISQKSLHRNEALIFMHYLAQKETAQKFYSEAAKIRPFGEPYARVDLAATLKDNPLVYPFVSQMPSATSSFFASNTFDGDGGLNSISNRYLENAVNAMSSGSSAESVIETLNKGLAQVFEKYGIR